MLLVLLPPGVATREVVGPLEIIHERLGLDVVWAGRDRGPVPGHDPPMSFHADIGLDEVDHTPTMILLPGGFGSLELALDPNILEALRRLAASPAVVLAISTGSLPLAAAGLLTGQRVAGHWLSHPYLRRFGAHPVTDDMVTADRIITASGSVSAVFAARFASDLAAYGPRATGSFDLGQRA
jgi:putative intracellular protease/amidase